MKRLFWVMFLIVLLPLSVVAQDFPRVEVFGGYSFFRMPSEFSASYAYTTEQANLSGWNLNATGNLTRWLGVDADFGGYHGNANALYWHSPTPVNYLQDFDIHSYMFGPRLSYRTNKFTPFAHLLIGGVSIGSIPVENSSQKSFGWAVGGGCDIRVANRFAIRAIQADFIKSSLTYNGENNLRLSTGVVVRF
jgi:opacity protein-like surface antigen